MLLGGALREGPGPTAAGSLREESDTVLSERLDAVGDAVGVGAGRVLALALCLVGALARAAADGVVHEVDVTAIEVEDLGEIAQPHVSHGICGGLCGTPGGLHELVHCLGVGRLGTLTVGDRYGGGRHAPPRRSAVVASEGRLAGIGVGGQRYLVHAGGTGRASHRGPGSWMDLAQRLVGGGAPTAGGRNEAC